MDIRAWVVIVGYGLLVGLVFSRFKQEQRAMLGALAVATLTGLVVWFLRPGSLAGPSLGVGCGLAFLSMLLTRRRDPAG